MGRESGIVNIGAQRVQRNFTLGQGLAPGDFGAAKSAGTMYFYSQAAGFHHLLNVFFHGFAMGNSFFQIQGDVLRDNSGGKIRLWDFLDINLDFNFFIPNYLFSNVIFQLFNRGAAPADNDARSGGIDVYFQGVGRAINNHTVNAGFLELTF